VTIGRKAKDAVETEAAKQSKHTVRKIAKRNETRTLEHLEQDVVWSEVPPVGAPIYVRAPRS